jgi:hypothetical protein
MFGPLADEPPYTRASLTLVQDSLPGDEASFDMALGDDGGGDSEDGETDDMALGDDSGGDSEDGKPADVALGEDSGDDSELGDFWD